MWGLSRHRHSSQCGVPMHRFWLNADRYNPNAEAEHRELLAAVLLKSRTKSFAEVLASIPNVGEDADFARIDDDAR
jgi:hypothetical protein